MLTIVRGSSYAFYFIIPYIQDRISRVVMNSNIFYQGIQLDFVEDLENGKASKWVVNIPTSQTYTFGLGEADYTITVETTEEVVRIVHEGILDVQNPVVSNYKYEPVVLRNVSPTEDDWDYVNGCIWLSPTEAFVLLRKDKLAQKATWVSLTSTQLPNRDVIEKLTEQDGKLNYNGQPIVEEPENQEVLDKLSEQDGKLLYNGQEIKPTPKQSIDEQSTHEDIPSAKAVEDRIETFAEEVDSKLADKADLVDGKVPLEQLPDMEITKQKVEDVLTGDITSHNHATEIGNHNASELAHPFLKGKIDEARAIAEGKVSAMSFETKEQLDAWLEIPENVETLLVGTNFYIEDLASPDYWWNGTTLVELSTDKIDLTEYAKKTELLTLGTTENDAYRGDLGQIAYNHSQSAHAPSNAQKNSDITKAEIEAKLIGEISSHSHALPTHNHTKNEITDFPTTMTPTAHQHTKSEITDFPTIPTIPDITVNNGSAESGKYISQIAVDATDKHKLVITKADLPQGFSGKFGDLTEVPDEFTPSEHNHDDRYYTESEVDTKLGGKANTTHNHTTSEITDFPTTMTPTAHNHTISEITDFPTIPTIPDITVNNGSAESGKYISQIAVDATDKHKLIITKADLPQGFATEEAVQTKINTHNTSETAHTDIRNAVAETKAIAEGKSRARVFATESALNTWLSNPENVALLQIGDNFYIEETDKPDYWWNGTTIKELETQKVDLTEYAKKTDIPDITVNNGSAESGKYISQVAVDATDKHKLIVTKADLPQGFSGNYNDLTNKPTIPTVPTISTNITTDALDDAKTASPKAVKTYVDNAISAALDNLLGGSY